MEIAILQFIFSKQFSVAKIFMKKNNIFFLTAIPIFKFLVKTTQMTRIFKLVSETNNDCMSFGVWLKL